MEDMLIQILAESDALHEPIRDWSNNQKVLAVHEARDDFRRIGLRLPRRGGSSAGRVQFSRMLDQIEKSGDVLFHRLAGVRVSWRLSDEIDWRLRSECTGRRWADTLTTMLILREHIEIGKTNNGFVGDWILASATPTTHAGRIHDVSAILAPALARDWARSSSDIKGRVGYKLTATGRKFLDAPLSPPEETDFVAALGKKYLQHWNTSTKNLQSLRPRRETAICIPLSADDWPGGGRRKVPSIFDARGKVRTPADMVSLILKNMDNEQ